MALCKMFVLSKAADGQYDELQRWYRERHIPDLLATPGFKDADFRRAKMLKQPDGTPQWDFITIYTIEADDPMLVVAEAGQRLGTALMPRSDALASDYTVSWLGLSDGE